jgi:putative ABC transport system permease protein
VSTQSRISSHAGLSWQTSTVHGWQSAAESLAAHKLRSGLTLLGIVVGVAALLAINVFGQLTQQQVARQFGPLGATLVSITPQVPPPPAGAGAGPVMRDANSPGPRLVFPPELDEKDLQALQSLPHVTAAALHSSLPPDIQAMSSGQNLKPSLIAATPGIQSVLGYTVASGSFFTEQDEGARANVAVIGAAVAATLFPGQDAVGQSVQLNNVAFTVKGVFSPQGTNGNLDLDQISVVPYSVLDRLRGNRRMFVLAGNPVTNSGALLQVDDIRNVPQVESNATQLIQQLHPPKPDEQPYVSSDFTQAIQTASQSTNTVRLALAGVAAVGMLLGAFGLFSMMTVSVTERTREIGVRMAVGARTRDVQVQFLFEAALLGLVGGVVGAVLGGVVSAFVPNLMGTVPSGYALPSPDAVIGVLAGSVALGIVFGVVPARRAANLDPASALRRG